MKETREFERHIVLTNVNHKKSYIIDLFIGGIIVETDQSNTAHKIKDMLNETNPFPKRLIST